MIFVVRLALAKALKTAEISWRYYWFPCEMTWKLGISKEVPCWWHVTSQVWVELLTGWSTYSLWHYESKALHRSGWWHITGIEFLHLFFISGSCHGETSGVVKSYWLFSGTISLLLLLLFKFLFNFRRQVAHAQD